MRLIIAKTAMIRASIISSVTELSCLMYMQVTNVMASSSTLSFTLTLSVIGH